MYVRSLVRLDKRSCNGGCSRLPLCCLIIGLGSGATVYGLQWGLRCGLSWYGFVGLCSEGLQNVVALGSGGDIDFGVDGNP